MAEQTLSKKERIPSEVLGIQVNFCKNPECGNYGVPASPEPQQGKSAKGTRDAYRSTGSTKKRSDESTIRNVPCLLCLLCSEVLPIKNNLGIAEEIARMMRHLRPTKEPSCPNPECSNHKVGISEPGASYRLYGLTHASSPRYLCRLCGRTFALTASTARHRLASKNTLIFTLLVNKMPMRRICEIADISPRTLYDKIDFFYQQTQLFAGERERLLLEGKLAPERLYISVDRQDHLVNWTQREDKRNTQLSAIGSADNTSGYVFGIHLNYDSSLDQALVDNEARRIGDTTLRPPFRRFARLWLTCDLPGARLERTEQDMILKNFPKGAGLDADILRAYSEAQLRQDVEVFDLPIPADKLPVSGMQVHAEYTVYGHFFFLHALLKNAGKIRFFLDQESGIRAACLAAFRQRVQDHTCDAFYVRINKELTVNQKRKIMADLNEKLEAWRRLYPHVLSDTSLRRLMIEKNLHEGQYAGPWQDRWVDVPSPSMSEPEKKVCHLTALGDYDDSHLAALMDRASLHGIDRFFMQVRRLLSPAERPIRSASNAGRTWHQYSAYNPQALGKILEIFRVYYNFLKIGKDGKTPAMRLGLARGVINVNALNNFLPKTQRVERSRRQAVARRRKNGREKKPV